MNEIIFTGLAFFTGIALGTIFFGGLWITVKKATNSKIPALWFFGSLAIRIAITLSGFYFIGNGDLLRLLTCFIGFVIARFLVIRFTKAYDLKHQKKEATHGS